MPSELNIEQMIREAMERGEFEDLKGKGKPLDLDPYFNTPEELRMAFSLLKSNDYIPEEVEMLKEIAHLKKQIQEATVDADLNVLKQRLHDRSLAFQIAIEKYKRK